MTMRMDGRPERGGDTGTPPSKSETIVVEICCYFQRLYVEQHPSQKSKKKHFLLSIRQKSEKYSLKIPQGFILLLHPPPL